jgi:hypothetical protein
MSSDWNGTKSYEEMNADQARCLTSSGYKQSPCGRWRGKHYDADATDEPGLPVDGVKFNCLIIRYPHAALTAYVG